jgi:hypothetical protein
MGSEDCFVFFSLRTQIKKNTQSNPQNP